MIKLGRNDPCHCGSRRKAKRCCGVESGPSEADLAKAFLSIEARLAAERLVSLRRESLGSVLDQLYELPRRFLSLHLALPEIITPDLRRLMAAIAADDPDEFDRSFPFVLARVDTPQNRAGLARTVLQLVESGEVDPVLGAAAIVDLAKSEISALLGASVIQSVTVAVGVAPTPSGLIVGGSPATALR